MILNTRERERSNLRIFYFLLSCSIKHSIYIIYFQHASGNYASKKSERHITTDLSFLYILGIFVNNVKICIARVHKHELSLIETRENI